MSRGPYIIETLTATPDGHLYQRGVKTVAITREDARAVVRAEYKAHGVIPDVFDAEGRGVQVYTNEEVAKWGGQC